MTARTWGLATTMALLLATGCSGSDDDRSSSTTAAPEEAASDPSAPGAGVTSIVVAATDYAFSIDGEVPAGPVTFRVQSEGDRGHIMNIARMTQDTTEAQVETILSTPSPITGSPLPINDNEDYGALVDEVVTGDSTNDLVPAGQTIDFEAELTPGLYVMSCYVNDDDGVSHFDKGQYTIFTVT